MSAAVAWVGLVGAWCAVLAVSSPRRRRPLDRQVMTRLRSRRLSPSPGGATSWVGGDR